MYKDAVSMFMREMLDIAALDKELGELAEDHMGHSPDEINWGHVGTAQHIHEQLSEILTFAIGKMD